eukprot:scaffold20429_cov75-Skeletonema_dohrnii-CCMP3373.AAC.1
MMTSKPMAHRVIGSLLMCLLVVKLCASFQSGGRNVLPHCRRHALAQNRRDTSLAAGLFGKKEQEGPSSTSTQPQADAPIPTRLFNIPAKSIKPGGMRVVLGFSLIGLQNTPDQGSWKANQSSDTVLDMVFRDNSAMFSITLGDDGISVDRYGTPSLPYLLQESVILHSVLDEIDSIANEGDAEAQDRLLQLEEEGDAIEEARSTLPARPQ